MARFEARDAQGLDESEVTQELEGFGLMPLPGPDSSEDEVPVLTVIAGRATGRTFRLDAPEMVLGRSMDVAISVMDLGVSRNHAKVFDSDGEVWVSDLSSLNGTYVNERRITGSVRLMEGDCVRLGANTLLRFGYRHPLEEKLQEQLYDAAIRDPLTRAYNRRYFDECLAAEWAWSVRRGSSCALIAFDIDHFKRVNDTYGHQGGDKILEELGRVVALTVRREDTFARVGGEEFLILVRATAAGSATYMGERLRAVVERHRFRVGFEALKVTVSVGVVSSDQPDVNSAEEMVSFADQALYRAKQAGRNCVVEA